MIVRRPGRVRYEAGLALQLAARERVLAGGDDELILLEHEPVVTLGRRGGEVDAARLEGLATPVISTDRGGLATWHGPGQLVAYPVVDLGRSRQDVSAFVARLGAAMVAAADALGVPGCAYDACHPGVYIDGRKLGSIGLHIYRGVTTHGLALNVCCDLSGFLAITPCGFQGLVVTTLRGEGAAGATVEAAADALSSRLASPATGSRLEVEQ